MRNDGGDQGYLIYGLAKPRSALGVELTNVSQVLAGGNTDTSSYANATKRLTDLHVITSNSFDVSLSTQKAILADGYHDHDADGDYAIIKIDGGIDLNGNGIVDHVSPNTTSYGFENFTGVNNPGYSTTNNNGYYEQTINAANLSEGEHYITIRAYRHNSDTSSPEVFEDFKKVVYIDRLPPDSSVDSFDAITPDTSKNRRVVMKSIDKTANNMHLLVDIGSNYTDAEILAMIGDSTQTNKVDRDQWQMDVNDVISGNHAFTVVTYEITGNYNVQRFSGFLTATSMGSGLGDLDADGDIDAFDENMLDTLLASNNKQFNAAGDMNGDGLINSVDEGLFDGVKSGMSLSALLGQTGQAVPEPSTVVLILGAIGLCASRRRQG